MNYTDIANKLIGPIEPAGKSEVDEVRFQNLQNMCNLVNDLASQIDTMVCNNQHAHEASIKRSVDYAKIFLTETLGIKE